jgi:hypothetical protein
LVPFGSLAGLSVLAALPGGAPLELAVLFGAGAVFAGRRAFDRRRNARKELRRRARASIAELSRVAREDRVASSQMHRLAGLQEGVLAAWGFLPEEYAPVLIEDLYTVVDEVEAAPRQARRRSELRRHLDGTNRRAVDKRVRELEKEVSRLAEGTELRRRFEAALAGRRGELEALDGLPEAIGLINARLEGVESLLGNLRADLLALDSDPGERYADSNRLVAIKERVAYYRRGLDELRSRDGLVDRYAVESASAR